MPDLVTELGTAMKLQAVPFLSAVRVPSRLRRLGGVISFRDPHTPKAIAYALACAGRNSQAVGVSDQLMSEADLDVTWQRDIADQAKALRAKLVANPAEAQLQLEAWNARPLKIWDSRSSVKSRCRPRRQTFHVVRPSFKSFSIHVVRPSTSSPRRQT